MASCVKTTSIACDITKTSQEKDRSPKNQVTSGQGELKETETEKVVERLRTWHAMQPCYKRELY